MAKSKGLAAMMVALTREVTKDWAKQMKAEERHASAQRHRRDRLIRAHTVSVKDAAYRVMANAYAKASDRGSLPANARQIMYAARPAILDLTGKESLGDAYFTQQLLPDYMDDHPSTTAGWDVVYDARGSFIEPHTNHEVAIGTIEVRNYLHRKPPDERAHVGGMKESWNYPTSGPKNRYKSILFIEKEGFDPLLRAAEIAERFDIAIMSTKGMSTTASRQLLDRLSPRIEKILVLHDFDVSGFTICGTLSKNSRRYRFSNRIPIVDIGLRLADVEEFNLESEGVHVTGQWSSRVRTLRRYGATTEEIEFLQQDRVELNAMTSRQFLNHLEAKLAEHGVTKVVPDAKVIESQARHLLEVQFVNEELEKLLPEIKAKAAAAQLPAGLPRLIAKELEKVPAWAWDRALFDLIKRLPPKPPRRLPRITTSN